MSGGISLPLPENLEVLAAGTPLPCACRGRSMQAWLRSCQQEVCRRTSGARLQPASKAAPAGAGGSSRLVHSTWQTLGSPQWVRTPSTLHSAEAEPRGCSPLRNSSVVMDLTRTRLVWSHHKAQQAGTAHPAQAPAPTASRGDRTAMGREGKHMGQAPSSSAKTCAAGRKGQSPSGASSWARKGAQRGAGRCGEAAGKLPGWQLPA